MENENIVKTHQHILSSVMNRLLGEPYEPLDEASEYYNIQSDIIAWNVNRNNTTFNSENELAMIDSEATEAMIGLATYLNGIDDEDEETTTKGLYEYLDGLCDTYVVVTGTLAKSGRVGVSLSGELYDWAIDYFNIPEMVEKVGFDFTKCMQETIKEISSRKQDPAQAEAWHTKGVRVGEKWLKDKNQDPKTLYKADYSKCKL